MPKLIWPHWQICLFHAILFASLLITQITSVIVKETEKAVPDKSIGEQIDDFLQKLKELKDNPPKVVVEKHAILCKETQVALEYMEKILAFLELLEKLTEKMTPHQEHYSSLATFDNKFRERCARCIEEIIMMQNMDKVNPYSATYYNNLENFLEQGLLFKGVKGNGVIDQKMNAVREKIKEYLALLQVEKLILNYHVHTLTKIATIFEENSKLYKTKYIPFFYKIARHFVSSLTTEQRQLFQMKVEKRENKITAGKMSEMRKRELMAHELQAIFYDEKKLPKGFFDPYDYMRYRKHELMNGATGQLLKFVLEILRNILAGTRENPKTLETTWILAERIVIPAFEYYTESPGKNGFAPTWVTTYLKPKMSLPANWIEKERQIMHSGKYSIDAMQQAQVRYYTGLVLLAYVTLMKSSKTLFGVEQYKGSEEKEAEKEKAEELTKTLSHLPIYFGLLLEQAFMGTLPKSNMIEEGRQDSGVNGDKKPTSNNDGNHQGSTDTKRDGLKRDNHGAIRAMNYKYVNNSPVSMVGKQFGGYQHHVAKKTAFPKWDNDKIVEEIGTSDDENHISDEELDKSDKAKRVEHKLIEVIGTSKKTDAPAANEIDMTKKTMKTADEIGTTGKKYESVVDMDIDTE